MTTAIKRQRLDGRLGRAAVLGLLALAAVLCQAGEAQAQWTTSGTTTTTTNSVGIGTTTPTAKLEVVGPAAGTGPTIRAGGGGDVVLGTGGSLFFDNNYSYGTGSFIRPLAANVQGFFTSGAERMRIDATGNIGIGTGAPAARFHVVGANGANGGATGGSAAPLAFNVLGGAGGNSHTAGFAGGGLSFQGGSGGWNTTGSSYYYSGNGGAIDLRGGTGGKHLFGVAHAGIGGAINITGGTGGDHNVVGFAGGVGGSVVLNGGVGGTGSSPGPAGNVLLANERGNVGVGTAAPAYKLDVAGQVRSSAGGFVFPDGTVQTTAATGGGGGTTASSLSATNVSAGPFGANVGGGNFSFPASVGFGTTSPGHRLHVVGAGQEGIIVDATSYPEVRFDRGGVPKAYLAVAGAPGGYGGGTLADSVVMRSEKAVHLISNGGTVGLTVNGGNVGLGTSEPSQKLDVRGHVLLEVGTSPTLYTGTGSAELNRYLNLINSPGLTSASGLKTGGVLVSDDYSYANPGKNDVIVKGNVGVGTNAPAAKLHVAGDIRVDGNINAKYQDVAEWVPSTQKLVAGTVVILDPERTNHVLASTASYDTAVAGVVSEKPGLSLGEAGEGKALVATTGRVKVKVDATRAPVRIGDLLVTSDVAGVAMKSEPVVLGGRRMHAPGTIIGKALEPLAGGTGEILVLLSLQ
jgi:hypothetical protein